ncbi:deaminase domain-containing protein [Deefgea piscis]|uniref:deaminase domain-containing protein n=1 Tax=Deefgea piscis TaxID=2739061 RepID=UPI001C812D8B|nr:deaminase domain-containing protein [Deefgea piscis]QZA82253.1 hypothetical protein K4H25_06320 [Deefgea piscis]
MKKNKIISTKNLNFRLLLGAHAHSQLFEALYSDCKIKYVIDNLLANPLVDSCFSKVDIFRGILENSLGQVTQNSSALQLNGGNLGLLAVKIRGQGDYFYSKIGASYNIYKHVNSNSEKSKFLSDALIVPDSTKENPYKAKTINNEKYPRYSDSEYLLLNAFASMNSDKEISGALALFTERIPCESCKGVIINFSRDYPKLLIYVCFSSLGTKKDEYLQEIDRDFQSCGRIKLIRVEF